MKIELDQEKTKQHKTPDALAEFTSQSDNDITQAILSNPSLMRALTRQDRANEINYDLASEVYAVLNEVEGNYHEETSRGHRIINWEVNNVPYYILWRAAQTEPARLIIDHRRLDLAQYGKAPKEQGVQRGFKLRFRNEKYNPSREERAKLHIWQQKIIDTFFYPPNDDAPSLARFIGAAYEDWFTYDDMTFEIRRYGDGVPAAIHVQDPKIYKPVIKKRSLAGINDDYYRAMSELLGHNAEFLFGKNILKDEEDDKPDFVLMYGGQEIGALTRDNLIKSHFFVQSNFRRAKRGYSVIEQGLGIVAWLIDTLKMNASNFNRNKLADKLLVFPGIGQFQLTKIQKILNAYLNGTTNSNRLPMVDIMSKDGKTNDAKTLELRGSSREMEFHLWWSLLFSLWAHFSGTDPNELSMSSHKGAVEKGTPFKESIDGIIKESRDVGAKTFLSHLADTLNRPLPSYGKNVFQHITGMDVECEFVGFEIEDKKLKNEIYEKELKTSSSRNEVLAKEDKEEYKLMVKLDGKEVNYFDIPGTMDTNLHQIITAKIQQQVQEEQMQMQAGMEGGEEQPGEEEEPQLTDEDKALLEEYGDKSELDEDLKKMLNEDEEEE